MPLACISGGPLRYWPTYPWTCRPGSAWQGHGYFDANFGARPLEQDFRTWTSGRYPDGDRALCFHDGVRRDSRRLSLASEADQPGLRKVPPPPQLVLKRTAWGLKRATRGDAGSVPVQRQSLLDAPFYSRNAVETHLGGKPVLGVHEALDLDRYRWPWLKPMIALRVPGRAGWP